MTNPINPIDLVSPSVEVFWTAFARIQPDGRLQVDLGSMQFAQGQDIKALAEALDKPSEEGRSPFREALDVATWSLTTEELHPNSHTVQTLYKGPQGLVIVGSPQGSGDRLAIAAWIEPFFTEMTELFDAAIAEAQLEEAAKDKIRRDHARTVTGEAPTVRKSKKKAKPS
jgi:hypothetical protein